MKAARQAMVFMSLVAAGLASTADARAADARTDVRVRAVVKKPVGCGYKRPCCPDRYACYSLYGAYGPLGGGSYWTRYSYGGWGYIR